MNTHDNLEFKRLAERVTALEALSWTARHPMPPQYREPTIPDAEEFMGVLFACGGGGFGNANVQRILKQLGFVKKVQP